MFAMLSRQSALSLTRPYLVAATLAVSATTVCIPANAASCTIPKSYYKHVSCTSDSRYFLAVKDIGLPVALINKSGKKVLDLSRYQRVAADKISGGLMPIQRLGKVGYVNMKGREVIPAVYDQLSGSQGWARPVAEGRIVVKKNGKYGVITTGKKVIIPFSSDITNITDYQGGFVKITKRNQGTQRFDKLGNISKPTPARRAKAPSRSPARNSSNPVSAEVTPPKSSAPFTTLYPHQQDGRWGFVDDNDVTMITYSFHEVMPFSEGLAGVRIDDKWGFVNLGGQLVIPFRFDDKGVDKSGRYKGAKPFTFKNGKAWVGNLKSGIKMCINTEGTNVSCDD